MAAPQKKSEIKELQDQLASPNIKEKKIAIRKIIDAMTRGKDVSMLFIDIEKNIHTGDMELKKLIYLYIISYAKSHPDKAILAINTLRKDAMNKQNPLLRALALRTMGCIRVKQIVEYLIDPLKAGLKDEDSYVRKTAVLCIAKLYELSPELIEEQGFLKLMENLLNDGNAFVVSNALSGLQAASEFKGQNLIPMTSSLVGKLLTAMNECTEWGQVAVLDALVTYTPADDKECEGILERVAPRLSHQNSGLVLSAVKVIMKYMDYLTAPEKIRSYCRKLSAPLISLMGNEPELQFVALKNINIILQKRPMILEKELKIFFCNFNDPIYIKLEKLDVIVRLANMENIQQALHELKEYSNEVDVEFVRKSIKCIGRCAIKLDKAAEQCIHVLWECLKTKVNYIVQESIIVIRDIFRKYPQQYVGILKDLCENLKTLDDNEAKAAMIWIIGEHVETIENADQLMNNFIENFKEEPSVVQIQILTSTVKLFLMRPDEECHTLVKNLLSTIMSESENPDLRDRGYIYWRLLAIDPELAKKVVCAERPTISDQSYTFESELLDILVNNIGSLASLYQKPPEQFVKRLRETKNLKDQQENEDDEDPEYLLTNYVQQQNSPSYDPAQYQVPVQQQTQNNVQFPMQESSILGSTYQEQMQQSSQQVTKSQITKTQPVQQQMGVSQVNLLDEVPSVNMNNSQQINMAQSISLQQSQIKPYPQSKNIKIPLFTVLSSTTQGSAGKSGIEVEAAFQQSDNKILLEINIINKSSEIINDFQVKFNINAFKLQPTSNILNIQSIPPNGAANDILILLAEGPACNESPSYPFKIQLAMKCSLDVFMFFVPCSLSVVIVASNSMSTQEYVQFQQQPNNVKTQNNINTALSLEQIKQKLINNNFSLVGSRTNAAGIEMISFSGKIINGMQMTLDIIYDASSQVLKLNYITNHQSLVPLIYQAIEFILKF